MKIKISGKIREKWSIYIFFTTAIAILETKYCRCFNFNKDFTTSKKKLKIK